MVVVEIFQFKREVTQVDYGSPGDPEPDFMVMKVVAICEGVESCHVCFLPWHVVAHCAEG